MRISELEKREDFHRIFTDTISEYWSDKFDKNITVKVSKGFLLKPKIYAHKYFNFIVPKGLPVFAFDTFFLLFVFFFILI